MLVWEHLLLPKEKTKDERIEVLRSTTRGDMDLMRRSAGNTTNGEFTIAFANGPIKFRSEEGVLYSRLFHIVRSSLTESGTMDVCCLRLTQRKKEPADTMLLLLLVCRLARWIRTRMGTLAVPKEQRLFAARGS
jgi:hypothetical protein